MQINSLNLNPERETCQRYFLDGREEGRIRIVPVEWQSTAADCTREWIVGTRTSQGV